MASCRADPGQSEQVNLLGPTSAKIMAIQEFREKNRSSTYFNHLSAVSESIPALGWVTIVSNNISILIYLFYKPMIINKNT